MRLVVTSPGTAVPLSGLLVYSSDDKSGFLVPPSGHWLMIGI